MANTIIDSYLRQVSESSAQPCIVIDNNSYTYTAFHEMVLHCMDLVADIQKETQSPINRIAVYTTDSITTYACIFAIFLSGAVYIPINSKFPEERNNLILEKAQTELIMNAPVDCNWSQSYPIIYQKEIFELSNRGSKKSTLALMGNSQPLAYILFTSGTTGEPKGVPIRKESINFFFNYIQQNFSFSSKDRFLQINEFTFDVSVFTILFSLCNGATLYHLSLNEGGIKFLQVITMLKKYEITCVTFVPSILYYLEKKFSEISLPHLRYQFFVGEPLRFSVLEKWKRSIPFANIYNFYGPTEITIYCSVHEYTNTTSQNSTHDIVPLGPIFPQFEYKILNEFNQGDEEGELCLAGVQVFDGYINASNSDSFLVVQNQKFYRTGDIVRKDKYGELHFISRKDFQVKVNGHRIELGEIEHRLSLITKNVSIVAAVKKLNFHVLYAFVKTDSGDEDKIKSELAKWLPQYMIPEQIFFVPDFPKNINGKIDRLELIKMFVYG
jgi:D-alanine--poly(phosphoribitol) ligase subunit 1